MDIADVTCSVKRQKNGYTSAHGGQALQATSCDRDLPICNTPPAKFAECASGLVLLSFLA